MAPTRTCRPVDGERRLRTASVGHPFISMVEYMLSLALPQSTSSENVKISVHNFPRRLPSSKWKAMMMNSKQLQIGARKPIHASLAYPGLIPGKI